MFFEGEKVKTCREVTKDARNILMAAGIRPGQEGIVLCESTYVTISFDGKLVTVKEDAIELVDQSGKIKDDVNLDAIRNMFGMR